MPYEIAFGKAVPIADRAIYINECCVGGDVVLERLPAIRERFAEVQAEQEARRRRWGLFDRVVDAPELDEVRQRVEAALAGWTDAPCRIARVDAEYHPTREGR